MDEHINSIKDACHIYIDAASAVLAEYYSSAGLRNKAIDLAMEKLKEQYEHLKLICDNTKGFVDMMLQPVSDLGGVHNTNALDTNKANRMPVVRLAYAQPREHMFPILKRQRESESDARYLDAADVSEEWVTVPIRLAHPQPREHMFPILKRKRETESDSQYKDVADVSEECKTAVSFTLAKFDLNK